MKRRQTIWIEIAAASTVAACSLAALLTICAAATSVAVEALLPTQAQAQQSEDRPPATDQTFEGIVTCSRCGARHSAARGKNAADCTRICAHDGASFALVDGEKTYILQGDPTSLKSFAGERVAISGVATGDTLRVVSILRNP